MTDTPVPATADVTAWAKDVAGYFDRDVPAVKAFATSLLSRKFVAAVGVIVPALIAKRWDVAATALLGYLGVEGAADVVTRVKS